MNYKNYTVIGADGANLRVLPSSLAQIAAHLKKGDTAKVITDFSSTNTAGGTTTKVTIQHPLNECLRNDETDRNWLVFETHISQYLGLFFKTPAFSGGC